MHRGGGCDVAFLGGFSETGSDCASRILSDPNYVDDGTELDEHGCPVWVPGTIVCRAPLGPPPAGSSYSPDGLGYCCDYGGTCDRALAGGFSETGADCLGRTIYDAHPAGYSTRLDGHGCAVLVTPLEPVCNPLPGWGDAPLDGGGGGTPSAPGCGCSLGSRRPTVLTVAVVLGLASRARRRRR